MSLYVLFFDNINGEHGEYDILRQKIRKGIRSLHVRARNKLEGTSKN